MGELISVLAVTIAIELPIVLWILRKENQKNLVWGVYLINTLTNLPLNLCISTGISYMYFGIPYNQFVGLYEVLILFVEAFCYKYFFEVDTKKAILVSVIANLVSFCFGYFVMY